MVGIKKQHTFAQARAISTAGGIPFNPDNPQDVVSVFTLNLRIDPFHANLQKIDKITQTIISGRPNEVTSSTGRDSKGHYLFSWHQLQEFLTLNDAQYCFLPSTEKYGHRTLWNKISLLNSSSYEQNKPLNQAKIMRLNLQGCSDFDINNLERILERDYT